MADSVLTVHDTRGLCAGRSRRSITGVAQVLLVLASEYAMSDGLAAR
jgi:hypothetical protein